MDRDAVGSCRVKLGTDIFAEIFPNSKFEYRNLKKIRISKLKETDNIYEFR